MSKSSPTHDTDSTAIAEMRDEVLHSLAQRPRKLSSKYFYDERGCRLFEQICELDEYYLTRTELAIMQAHAAQMAAELGPRCALIEYGSGLSLKTRLLLEHLEQPACYIPVEIAHDHLESVVEDLRRDFAQIPVAPVCADFTQPFDLPEIAQEADRRVIYFAGSTIGNFEREQAGDLLRQMRDHVGLHGGLLIGIDLVKEAHILEAAYNDSEGLTEAFNRNLLLRLNADIGSDFVPEQFDHRAPYCDRQQRIEMYLVSNCRQQVTIDGQSIELEEGESICTEHSHKYTIEQFGELAETAGWRISSRWTDPQQRFAVLLLEADH